VKPCKFAVKRSCDRRPTTPVELPGERTSLKERAGVKLVLALGFGVGAVFAGVVS
jgi:hypothetical protein